VSSHDQAYGRRGRIRILSHLHAYPDKSEQRASRSIHGVGREVNPSKLQAQGSQVGKRRSQKWRPIDTPERIDPSRETLQRSREPSNIRRREGTSSCYCSRLDDMWHDRALRVI
jgi:hypothetical protein